MKNLTINIQLCESDTVSDIVKLLSETINETNDKGYAIMNALIDGKEVFNRIGFSKELLDILTKGN